MPAVWIKSNSRAILLGMVPPTLTALLGTCLSLGWIAPLEPLELRLSVWALLLVSLLILAILAWQLRQPRLAYVEGELLVYLRAGPPFRVPLDIVECFLLGQAPTMLPGRKHEHSETASVVIKLADSAPDWARREVKPALGKWCEGYITLRGTWCEPLNVDVICRLNQQLDGARPAQPVTESPVSRAEPSPPQLAEPT